jgi:copper transport protein
LLPVALLLSALLGIGLLVDVATARPASAHATVVTTTPTDGARLAAAPAQVTIEFDEHVSLGAGYARVLDGNGNRVDTGGAAVHGDVLTVPLRTGLPDAGYVATWRVVSADSHPVSGAFSFVVGAGQPVTAAAVGGGNAIDPGVAVLLPLARWIGYAGLALGLGVPLTLALCWPGGWPLPRLRRASLTGLVAVAVGGVLLLLVQGPYAAAVGLGSLLDGRLLGTTLASGYGATLLLRIGLAVLLGVLLARGWRSPWPPCTSPR